MEKHSVFPIYIFPKGIRDIIEQTHTDSNYPISYIAAALFFAVSVAIGNCRTLAINASWKVKTILFMALLGSPGSAKTHPIKFAMNPFLKLDAKTLAEYKIKLKEWKRIPPEQRGDKPLPKQLRVQDITMEAITKILDSCHRGIFVFVDELKGWISSFNKYNCGGGDLEQWLSIYSGVPITVNRKTQDEIHFIFEPFVGVIGGLQPGIMAKVFGGEKMDNGFFFRLLFVDNSSEGEPLLWGENYDLPTDLEGQWESIIFRILETEGYFGNEDICNEYHFSEEAWRSIILWQNEIEKQNLAEPEYKTAIFRKIQDYCLRFALVIHTMREAVDDIPESYEIDYKSSIMATSLADYFYEQSQRAYEMVITGNVNNSKFFELLNGLNSEFTTAQALAVGERMGISRATVFRYLAVGPDDPFLKPLKHGRYQKK